MLLDLLRAMRWLRKNPLFTLAVTAILALGVGANTAVFSVVDAVLLRPLPYDSPERVTSIEEQGVKRPIGYVPASDYLLWRTRGDLFESMGAFWTDVVTLTGTGAPDQIRAERVTPGLFSLLGVRPRFGRFIEAADTGNSAVLSDRLWRRLFHADPGILGHTLNLSGEVFTVIGVMPPEFEFPDPRPEMWLPLRPAGDSVVAVVARLKPDVAIIQAQNAMTIVARGLSRQDPKKAGLRIVVSPWRETVEREYRLTLFFVLAAVGLVLLIACANVGSLLLSRAVRRRGEIAIRASLGASRLRLARQMLAESLALCALGSAAGAGTAYFALQFLSKRLTALPIAIPHVHGVALNGRVLAFNTLLCVGLALICGLAPVLFASRADLQSAMRGGRAAGESGATRLFSILIGSEAAFAFLLLAGSGLMVHSLIRLERADHGFHPDHVLTMRVPIGSFAQPKPAGQYETKPRQMEYYRRILEKIQRVPGVTAAAVANNLPLSGSNTSTPMQGPDGAPVLLSTRTISGDYFRVMGISLIAGRAFTDSDQTGSPRVAIVNEYLAHQLFPDRDPMGQALPAESPGAPVITIVGIVRNSPQSSYESPAKGELYMPYRQFIFGVFLSTVVVRTTGDPLSLASTLRGEIWSVDPNQPILKIETMDDVIAESIWRPRFSAWIFSIVGGLALLLTSAGIYGTVAYTTALRVREVGIRVALGAGTRRVVVTILRGSMAALGAGLAISIVCALPVYRLLASLLYEIGSADPLAYVAAGALLLSVGTVSSAIPAWKAARKNPAESLRME